MAAGKCLWGIAPQDDFTNEAIAAELAKTCEADEQKVSDKDGKAVTLYIVDHSFVTDILKVRTFKLRFKIYAKEGGAAWRERDLSKLKKTSKKTKEISDKLKNKK